MKFGKSNKGVRGVLAITGAAVLISACAENPRLTESSTPSPGDTAVSLPSSFGLLLCEDSLVSEHDVCVDCSVTVDWSKVTTDVFGVEVKPTGFHTLLMYEYELSLEELFAGVCAGTVNPTGSAMRRSFAGVLDSTSAVLEDDLESIGLPGIGRDAGSVMLVWMAPPHYLLAGLQPADDGTDSVDLE